MRLVPEGSVRLRLDRVGEQRIPVPTTSIQLHISSVVVLVFIIITYVIISFIILILIISVKTALNPASVYIHHSNVERSRYIKQPGKVPGS
eukprot:COSAG06_NODE_167_length_21546_cov_35.001352_31_plen_91_part_00